MTQSKPSSLDHWPAAIPFSLIANLALSILLLALAACETSAIRKPVLGPDYQPANVYRRGDSFPQDFRRVAVLPLTCDEGQSESGSGGLDLEPVLRTELLKTGKFELVWVAPDALDRCTGKKSWTAGDELPADFFAKLRRDTGCDGVLFCRVTRFRPYPPLVVGWKLTLIDARDTKAFWAIDELFDSGEPQVWNSARRYERGRQDGGPVTDRPLILTSPSRFGQYTAWAALNTMPAR